MLQSCKESTPVEGGATDHDASVSEALKPEESISKLDEKDADIKSAKPTKAFLKECDSYGATLYGAYLAFSKKEIEKALAAFDLSIKWNPSNARAHFHRGTMLLQLNRLKEAEASYLESLKHEPSFFFSYYNLACVTALDNRPEEAVKYAGLAMEGGYNRYSNFTTDTDLKSIQTSPKLAKSIQIHQAKEIEQKKINRYLLADFNQKLVQLKTLLTVNNTGWKIIAEEALLDTNERIRIQGLLLYIQYGNKAEKIERMVRGLFDNNGYVNKVAANALVAFGSKSMPHIEFILEFGNEDQKFFARQVKVLIERAESAESA